MLEKPAQLKLDADNLRGMGWMGISVLGASLMAIAVRGVSHEISSNMIVFYRAAIILAFMLAALAMSRKTRQAMRFSRPWLHVLRGSLIGFATMMGYYTIATIPLATGTVLFFTAPIFATLINMFLHGERVGPRRITAIVLGFLGAVIVLRPDVGRIEPGMVTAIGSSMCFALALSLSRNLARADGAVSTFCSSIFFTVLVSLPLAARDFQVPELGWTWIALSAVVVSTVVRGYADIVAYNLAEAAVLAPLTYMRLVLIGVAAYFVFGEVPDTATYIGAAIIVGSTLYIAQRQAALRRKAAKT